MRLDSGNTLISGNQHGWVCEVNPKGETLWDVNKDDLPGIPLYTVQEASRLANEVTPSKKVVWALRDWSTLGPASSTQLLDEPGAAQKGELQR